MMTGAYHCCFFVSLVGCVASTAGQQLFDMLGNGWVDMCRSWIVRKVRIGCKVAKSTLSTYDL